MLLARTLIFFNQLIFVVFTSLFIRTIWIDKALQSEFVFFLLSVTTLICIGGSWYLTFRKMNGKDNPYRSIPFIGMRHRLLVVRTHTLIRVVGCFYMNVAIASAIVAYTLGKLHLVGFLGILGYFWSMKLGQFYLVQVEAHTRNKLDPELPLEHEDNPIGSQNVG